jgi:hypothetical protein
MGLKRARVLCGCVLLQQACVQSFTRVPMSMLPPPYRRGVSVKSFKDSQDVPLVNGATTESEKYGAAGWYFPHADNSKSLLATPPVNPAGVYLLNTATQHKQQTGSKLLTNCNRTATSAIAIAIDLLRQRRCVYTSVRAAARVS